MSISDNPDNAELILRRGELHRVHRNWANALADYQRAKDLNNKLVTVELAIGQMYLNMLSTPIYTRRHTAAQ